MWIFDARKSGNNGTGRTIVESLPLFQHENVITAKEQGLGRSAGRYLGGRTGRIAAEGLLGRSLGDWVVQPWMMGPGGTRGTVLGVYDTIPLCLSAAKRAAFLTRLQRAKRSNTWILTLTQATAGELATLGIQDHRIGIVSPGIDHLKPYDPVDEVNGFVCVSRWSRHKGLDDLLRAWSRVRAPLPLTLVVPSPEVESPRSRAARKLGVEVVGGLRDQELIELMRRNGVVIVPSKKEGYGLPLMEAARTGCAVIATGLEVFKELPLTGAIFVTGGDEAWVEALATSSSAPPSPASFTSAPTWGAWRRGLHDLMAAATGDA